MRPGSGRERRPHPTWHAPCDALRTGGHAQVCAVTIPCHHGALTPHVRDRQAPSLAFSRRRAAVSCLPTAAPGHGVARRRLASARALECHARGARSAQGRPAGAVAKLDARALLCRAQVRHAFSLTRTWADCQLTLLLAGKSSRWWRRTRSLRTCVQRAVLLSPFPLTVLSRPQVLERTGLPVVGHRLRVDAECFAARHAAVALCRVSSTSGTVGIVLELTHGSAEVLDSCEAALRAAAKELPGSFEADAPQDWHGLQSRGTRRAVALVLALSHFMRKLLPPGPSLQVQLYE